MKWGVLCKKVENGGAFFEKMDFSSTQRALCAVSVFFILHFAYLGGCVRSQYTPCIRPALLLMMAHATELLSVGPVCLSVPPGPARRCAPRPGHQSCGSADPSAHGRRSAASGGGHIFSPRDNLLTTIFEGTY